MDGWAAGFGRKLFTACTASSPPMKTTTQKTFVCRIVRLHSPRKMVAMSLANEL